jgi:hypothetical protein
MTDPADIATLAREAELRLHLPETRNDPDSLAVLLADELAVFGTSGLAWTRSEFLKSIMQFESSSTPFELTDITTLAVTPDVALITYVSTLPSGKRARRASLWRATTDGPQLVFHQGTSIS